VDQVGDNKQLGVLSSFPVPSGDVTLSGWAVDALAKSEAGGVDVVVDGNPYQARYGLGRPDVATATNVPAYGKSGFSFVLAAGSLSKGKHDVIIRVISADTKSYSVLRKFSIDVQ